MNSLWSMSWSSWRSLCLHIFFQTPQRCSIGLSLLQVGGRKRRIMPWAFASSSVFNDTCAEWLSRTSTVRFGSLTLNANLDMNGLTNFKLVPVPNSYSKVHFLYTVTSFSEMAPMIVIPLLRVLFNCCLWGSNLFCHILAPCSHRCVLVSSM